MKLKVFKLASLATTATAVTFFPSSENTVMTYGPMEFAYSPTQNSFFALSGEPTVDQKGYESIFVNVPPAKSPVVWNLSGKFVAPVTGAYEFAIGAVTRAVIHIGESLGSRMTVESTEASMSADTSFKKELEKGIVYDLTLKFIGSLDFVKLPVLTPGGQNTELGEFVKVNSPMYPDTVDVENPNPSTPNPPVVESAQQPSFPAIVPDSDKAHDGDLPSIPEFGSSNVTEPLTVSIESDETESSDESVISVIEKKTQPTIEDGTQSQPTSETTEVNSAVPDAPKDVVNHKEDEMSGPSAVIDDHKNNAINENSPEKFERRGDELDENNTKKDSSSAPSSVSVTPGVAYTLSLIKGSDDSKDVLKDDSMLEVFHKAILGDETAKKRVVLSVPTAIEVLGYVRVSAPGQYTLSVGENAIASIQIHGQGIPESDIGKTFDLDETWNGVDTRLSSTASINFELGKAYPFRLALLNGSLDNFDWDIKVLDPEGKKIDLFGLYPKSPEELPKSPEELPKSPEELPKQQIDQSPDDAEPDVEQSQKEDDSEALVDASRIDEAESKPQESEKDFESLNRTNTFDITKHLADVPQPIQYTNMVQASKGQIHNATKDSTLVDTSVNEDEQFPAASAFSSDHNVSHTGVWKNSKARFPVKEDTPENSINSSKLNRFPVSSGGARSKPSENYLGLVAQAIAEARLGIVGTDGPTLNDPEKNTVGRVKNVPKEQWAKAQAIAQAYINPQRFGGTSSTPLREIAPGSPASGSEPNSGPLRFPVKNDDDTMNGTRFPLKSFPQDRVEKAAVHKENPVVKETAVSDEIETELAGSLPTTELNNPKEKSLSAVPSAASLFEEETPALFDVKGHIVALANSEIAFDVEQTGKTPGFDKEYEKSGTQLADERSHKVSPPREDVKYEGTGSRIAFAWRWVFILQLMVFF